MSSGRKDAVLRGMAAGGGAGLALGSVAASIAFLAGSGRVNLELAVAGGLVGVTIGLALTLAATVNDK